MAEILMVLPSRGNIDRLELFTSGRDGQDRLRVFSDGPIPHEPPSITEILAASGITLTTADGSVKVETLEHRDEGRTQRVRITGSPRVVAAIRSWSEPRSMRMMRDETNSPEPNRDGLVEVDTRR